MANLTNNFQEQRKEPIVFSKKQMTADIEIAETFSKFYTGKQKRTAEIKRGERILKRLIGRNNLIGEDRRYFLSEFYYG